MLYKSLEFYTCTSFVITLKQGESRSYHTRPENQANDFEKV